MSDFSLDLGSIINRGIATAPAIIQAARQPTYGSYNPYGVGGSGQTTISPAGLNTSGGFNLSTNTIVMVGLVGLVIWLIRKK